MLALVNSAMFALPWKVDSIGAAVRIVGTSQIRDLAVATSVLSLFEGVPDGLLDVDSFRHHSLACGVTARVLASQRGENNIERFFVAGLLHDIGRLVLIVGARDEMGAALDESRATGKDLRACEREHVGCTHDQAGAALMERWRFPDALREAVRFHHEPRRATRFPVEAAAVHVADVVAHILQWGRSGRPLVPRLDTSAWQVLGLATALVPIVVEEADRQIDASKHLIPVEESSAC
jgi:putative nucleotidyltransferase with HDIG domain